MSATRNLVLIGMPGAGKSTLGVLVAKALAMPFVDVDVTLQAQEGYHLAELLARRNLDGFCDLEGAFVRAADWRGTVIATGGSVVYRADAMEHLQRNGRLVYLHASLNLLQTRLGDLDRRGVVRRPNQDLAALYAERHPLYCQYAHATVECDGQTPDELVAAIRAAFEST